MKETTRADLIDGLARVIAQAEEVVQIARNLERAAEPETFLCAGCNRRMLPEEFTADHSKPEHLNHSAFCRICMQASGLGLYHAVQRISPKLAIKAI